MVLTLKILNNYGHHHPSITLLIGVCFNLFGRIVFSIPNTVKTEVLSETRSSELGWEFFTSTDGFCDFIHYCPIKPCTDKTVVFSLGFKV